MKKKKILITGANGFIGTHLTKLLHQQNLRIRTTDLPGTTSEYIQKNQIEFIPADLTDKKSLEKVVESIKTIFHVAAVFKLSAPAKLLFEVNVEGTRNLLEVAKEKGVKKVIVWSSSSVYGVTKEKIIRKESEELEQFREEDYAQSKYMEERLALGFHQPKFRIIAIRPTNVYGPGTTEGLGTAMYSAKKGLMRQVPGARPVFTSHVHAEDVARAAYFLSTKKEAEGEVYNVAEDEAVSADELFHIAAPVLGIKIKKGRTYPWMIRASARVAEFIGKITKKDPLFERHGAKYMIDHHIISNEKIRKLGFQFKHNVRLDLPGVIKWYIENDWKIFKQ